MASSGPFSNCGVSGRATRARAYGRWSLIEAKIAETPASSIIGVGVKLAVFAHANCHDDAATVQALSAYRDCERISGIIDPQIELRHDTFFSHRSQSHVYTKTKMDHVEGRAQGSLDRRLQRSQRRPLPGDLREEGRGQEKTR